MGPPRRRDSRHPGQTVPGRHQVLPVSSIEISSAVLPSSSSTCGLIVGEDPCPQVTRGGAAYGTVVSAAPLRVLLLPPASALPCESSADTPNDSLRRLLLQPDTEEDITAGSPLAEAREDELARTSVRRLARQACLTRELLPAGYQIAGVWLRVEEDMFEECADNVLQQHHQQHSLISSIARAIVDANALSPGLSLVPGKQPADLCCCFVFFSSRTVSGGETLAERGTPITRGYYCVGSTVASLVIRRLPVVIRQAEHPQPVIPLMQSIVYSTFFPLHVELSFVPSKSFTHGVQACCQQLSAALASQLYVSFVAVLSPPTVASCVDAETLCAPTSTCLTARHWSRSLEGDKRGCCSTSKKQVCCGSLTPLNEEAQLPSTCPTPKKAAEKLWRSVGNSASRSHRGSIPKPSSKLGEQDSHVDCSDNSSGESARQCSCILLSGLSDTAWDGFCRKTTTTGSYSACAPLCLLQPLLVGDFVSRYRISLDFSAEAPEQRVHPSETVFLEPARIKFRVVPVDTYDIASTNSFASEELGSFANSLSNTQSPSVLCVRGEFVAAIVASVGASVQHLRQSLAADAAAAVARRIAERLADACAAYYSEEQQLKQKPRKSPDFTRHAQQSAARTVASLETRRFYLANPVKALQAAPQRCDATCRALLLSDFSNPEETPDAAACAAAERFEFLLGIPREAVVSHDFLKDGGIDVAFQANNVNNVIPHELDRQHQPPGSVKHVLQQRSPAKVCAGTFSAATAFWTDLEGRAAEGMTKRLQPLGGETAYKEGDTSSILLWTCLVLFVMIVATYVLLPTVAVIYCPENS